VQEARPQRPLQGKVELRGGRSIAAADAHQDLSDGSELLRIKGAALEGRRRLLALATATNGCWRGPAAAGAEEDVRAADGVADAN